MIEISKVSGQKAESILEEFRENLRSLDFPYFRNPPDYDQKQNPIPQGHLIVVFEGLNAIYIHKNKLSTQIGLLAVLDEYQKTNLHKVFNYLFGLAILISVCAIVFRYKLAPDWIIVPCWVGVVLMLHFWSSLAQRFIWSSVAKRLMQAVQLCQVVGFPDDFRSALEKVRKECAQELDYKKGRAALRQVQENRRKRIGTVFGYLISIPLLIAGTGEVAGKMAELVGDALGEAGYDMIVDETEESDPSE